MEQFLIMTGFTELGTKETQELISIYDSVPEAVFLLRISSDNVIRFAGLNKKYEQEVGLKSVDFAGKTPHQVFPKEAADLVSGQYFLCIAAGSYTEYRELLFLNGELNWWDTSLEPVIKKGCVVAIIGRTKKATEKVRIASELAKAVENGELEIHYQPIVDVRTGKIFSYEGLLRWAKFAQGPGVFLQIAKEARLEEKINGFVVDSVVQQASRMDGDVKLAFNVRRFPVEHLLIPALKKYGVSPAKILVEIVEDANIDARSLAELRRLYDLGVMNEVDDYQTELAGLHRVKQLLDASALPVALKLDRRFICDVDIDISSQIICESVFDMVRRFNESDYFRDCNHTLIVIAEGVEKGSVLKWLRKRKCYFHQGFHPYLGAARQL